MENDTRLATAERARKTRTYEFHPPKRCCGTLTEMLMCILLLSFIVLLWLLYGESILSKQTPSFRQTETARKQGKNGIFSVRSGSWSKFTNEFKFCEVNRHRLFWSDESNVKLIDSFDYSDTQVGNFLDFRMQFSDHHADVVLKEGRDLWEFAATKHVDWHFISTWRLEAFGVSDGCTFQKNAKEFPDMCFFP